MHIELSHNTQESISRQIYLQIRHLILSHDLKYGDFITPSRRLAQELNVSRTVVMNAYEQLTAEGYLETKRGSATTVAAELPPNSASPISFPETISVEKPKDNVIDFKSGIPDLSLFPLNKWSHLYENICHEIPKTVLGYNSPKGDLHLRQVLSAHLLRTRGIHCSADQLFITSGATQGLSLISLLLSDSNRPVCMENPSHPGLARVIGQSGSCIQYTATDALGIIPKNLPADETFSFIYTTPSHQFPKGGILPISRRIELINYACENDCYIVEDDYDSDFRYCGSPVSSMFELAPEKVIYLGSFSKTLAPALRAGYIILPAHLRDSFLKLKQYQDVHSEILTQLTLSRFMEAGYFDRHVYKMKKIYSRKREWVLSCLERYFKNTHTASGDKAGLSMIVSFTNVEITPQLCKKISAEHVRIHPLYEYHLEQDKIQSTHSIVLGYGHLSHAEIETGIRKIASVFHCSLL